MLKHVPASTMRHLGGVQVLRGIAAVLVVIHHALLESSHARGAERLPTWFVSLGAIGVDIFFVISGFIMVWVSFPADGSERKRLTAGEFAYRRVLRIFPIYWIALACTLVLKYGGFYSTLELSSDIMLRSFLLLPGNDQVIGVAWTLVYEMYFYYVFAIGLLFHTPRQTVGFCIVAIIGLQLAAMGLDRSDLALFLQNPITYEFCFGMLLGVLFRSKCEPSARLALSFAVIGVFAAVASAMAFATDGPINPNNGATGNWVWDTHLRYWAWGIPAALIFPWFALSQAGRGRWSRMLQFVGDASYSIYLFHGFAIIGYAFLLRKTSFLTDLPQLAIVPLVVVFSTLVGAAAHLIAEKPINAIIKRIVDKRPAVRHVLVQRK